MTDEEELGDVGRRSSSRAAAASTAAVVVMGLPGSGKTGTCSSLVSLAVSCGAVSEDEKDVRANELDVAVVSFDAIARSRSAVDVSGWHAAREEAYSHVADRLAAAAAAHMGSGHVSGVRRRRAVVLVDDTMVYRSMRKRVHALAVDAGAAYACVHINTPLEVAMARDAARPASSCVGAATIAREAARLEPPDASGHAWEAWSVACDGTLPVSERAALVWSHLVAAPWEPASRAGRTTEEARAMRATGTAANAASRAHTADLRTRAMLARAVTRMADGERAARAAELSRLRRTLLEAARGCRTATGGRGEEEGAYREAERRFAEATGEAPVI